MNLNAQPNTREKAIRRTEGRIARLKVGTEDIKPFRYLSVALIVEEQVLAKLKAVA